jgi:lysophospholipase L1-like esterase
LPQGVLDELTEIGAVIENAGSPTKQPQHDTMLVRPDEELGHVLKPNARVFAYLLKSNKALNIDPPILYIDRPSTELSDSLKTYIADKTRLQFAYSTDEKGFRTTLPSVSSDREILVIGDSVPFGAGVDDGSTVASFLQKMLKKEYKVVNAGVGRYRGQQCFLMANKLSKSQAFKGLIYVACQNDFMEAEDSTKEVEDWGKEAEDVVNKLKSISHRFNHNIILVLHTYMQHNLRDVFLEKGWKDKLVNNTTRLRKKMRVAAVNAGFAYYDWSDLVSDYMEQKKSLFARFALYNDHCHLSPLGNRLMAEKVSALVGEHW